MPFLLSSSWKLVPYSIPIPQTPFWGRDGNSTNCLSHCHHEVMGLCDGFTCAGVSSSWEGQGKNKLQSLGKDKK